MKAVILAAGLGRRLRPLTFFRAKAAMPVLNIPLLFYTINLLKRHGIKDIIINLHHLPDTIKDVLALNENSEINIELSYEPTILGTAGALKKMQSSLQEDAFIVINGDIIFDLDIIKALEFHRKNRAIATMMILPYPSDKSYTAVLFDNKSIISQLGEEGRGTAEKSKKWMFSGVQILEPAVFTYIVREGFSDIIKDFYIPAIKNREPIFGFKGSGFWQEIGTPGDYIEAHTKLFSMGTAKIARTWGVECDIKNIIYANSQTGNPSASMVHDEDIEMGKDVIIKDWAVLGKGCEIGEECIIDKSIFFNDCVIEDKCYISNSILLEGVQLPSQSNIRDSIVVPEKPSIKKISIVRKVEMS